VAAQILELGPLRSTNSAQIIGTGPGICAVMGGASVTPAPPKFNLKFLGLRGSTNSGTWFIRQHKFSTNYWTKSGNLCYYGWCWRHGGTLSATAVSPTLQIFLKKPAYFSHTIWVQWPYAYEVLLTGRNALLIREEGVPEKDEQVLSVVQKTS